MWIARLSFSVCSNPVCSFLWPSLGMVRNQTQIQSSSKGRWHTKMQSPRLTHNAAECVGLGVNLLATMAVNGHFPFCSISVALFFSSLPDVMPSAISSNAMNTPSNPVIYKLSSALQIWRKAYCLSSQCQRCEDEIQSQAACPSKGSTKSHHRCHQCPQSHRHHPQRQCR